MNPKSNNAAVQRWGARKILTDLVNIPGPPEPPKKVVKAFELLARYPGAEAAAQDFAKRYGPLRHEDQSVDSTATIAYVALYAPCFRLAWSADTEAKKRCVSEFLDGIFAAAWTFNAAHPAIRADFSTGKWQPVARTLLDELGIELMKSRRLLHRCNEPECGRYFIRSFSRDRYCSARCGDLARGASQRRWAEAHREELNRRRRKPLSTDRTAAPKTDTRRTRKSRDKRRSRR